MSDQSTSAEFYDQGELLPEQLPTDPFGLFQAWFDEAKASNIQPNPDGFAVCTVDPQGCPSSRMVLCRGIDHESGHIVFYTNYDSTKARQLDENPNCCALFHWDHSQRQVRIEGEVVRSPTAESDAYFAHRKWESRVGAWASHQSQPIDSHQELMDRVADHIVELDLDLGAIMDGKDPTIARPPFWGGYRLHARNVEIWCGASGRIHDRARWTRKLTKGSDGDGDGFTFGSWSSTRLQP